MMSWQMANAVPAKTDDTETSAAKSSGANTSVLALARRRSSFTPAVFPSISSAILHSLLEYDQTAPQHNAIVQRDLLVLLVS